MTQRHSWSYSAVKDFKGCARRYHVTKVLKLYPYKDTDATLFGKEVHKALEEYVRDGKELPANMRKFKAVGDVILSIPGQKLCEHEMALTADRKPTGFKAKDVWVRGIADVLVIDGDKAFCTDWKTGGAKYPDKDQLELMALMVFEHFPEVNIVKGALAFVMHDVLVKAVYSRENAEKLWAKWNAGADLLDKAFEVDRWNPNPTPLCGWCPHESCEHWVGRRRR